MITNHRNSVLAVLAVAVSLSACSSHSDTANKQDAAWGSVTSEKPLTAGQVDVQLSLQGEPTLEADGKNIAVTVNLANSGKTALSSTGSKPVNLGAHSVDASGHIITLDLARASLPYIAPGSSATITISLPLVGVMNESVQILPVQEGVSWFDGFGTKPVTVGPFVNCGDAALGKVCFANGKPLATAPAH